MLIESHSYYCKYRSLASKKVNRTNHTLDYSDTTSSSSNYNHPANNVSRVYCHFIFIDSYLTWPTYRNLLIYLKVH